MWDAPFVPDQNLNSNTTGLSSSALSLGLNPNVWFAKAASPLIPFVSHRSCSSFSLRKQLHRPDNQLGWSSRCKKHVLRVGYLSLIGLELKSPWTATKRKRCFAVKPTLGLEKEAKLAWCAPLWLPSRLISSSHFHIGVHAREEAFPCFDTIACYPV